MTDALSGPPTSGPAPTNRTGAELKYAREMARLTQAAVAKKAGVSRFTAILWEQRAIVSAGKAERYLRAIAELSTEEAAS